MELWDIYNENKEKTGRTMKRNDWNMKPDEFHLIRARRNQAAGRHLSDHPAQTR